VGESLSLRTDVRSTYGLKKENEIGSWREPDGLCGGKVRPCNALAEPSWHGDCGYSMHTRIPLGIHNRLTPKRYQLTEKGEPGLQPQLPNLGSLTGVGPSLVHVNTVGAVPG
jgi:hypothetical protein